MGDIVRAFGDALRETSALTSAQHEVLTALARCRTAALGGHLAVCDHCGHATPVYNSCRNRHCPTCQGLDQHRWLEARRERILPTRYFHVVFTLPDALRAIVRHNRTALFAMLFEAASQTLLALSRDPRRLGALPAITMVLHTWTRELLFHPHLHAVVSAGGLSPDSARWVPTKGDYLFPVKVLAKLFRGKLRALLIEGLASGAVTLPPNSAPDVLDELRTALYRTDWVVYAKAPFGGAEQVYAYLGRYTHRVGISNARIRTMDERGVTFATKGGRECTLPGVEFLRRFVDHVLPKGFTRIRHYGLLAPCHATTTLERARTLLAPTLSVTGSATVATATTRPTWMERLMALTGVDAGRCPRCDVGRIERRPLAVLLKPAAVGHVVRARPGCVDLRSPYRRSYSDAFRHHLVDLRARYASLGLARFAEVVQVPLETIASWLRTGVDAPASETSPDAGKEAVSSAHIETILHVWKTWNGDFSTFCELLREDYRIPFRRTLLANILSSYGMRTPARREGRSPDERALRHAFEVFHPNAQWVGDGTQLAIDLLGRRYDFNLELFVDPYSGAFLGAALSDQEDSAAVIDTMRDAKETAGTTPIALLLDNKPSNHTEDVDAALGDTMRMRATPFRPENKAHIEGGFGLLKQTLPDLIVDAKGRRELAHAILKLVVMTFFRAVNHRPRRDRGGRSRAELHGAEPTLDEIERARAALRERCRQQELRRRTLEARERPEVRALLDGAFERLALLDPERSVRLAIGRYPLDAIVDGIAIFEGKLAAATLPIDADARYLLGIVKNVAGVNEGRHVTEALLRERIAARDRMLAILLVERLRVETELRDRERVSRAFVDRACAVDGVLDRSFWLLALVDVIRAAPAVEHEPLVREASRRIHNTFRIKVVERREAELFADDAIVALHEAAQGAHRELDRLATDALRAAARKGKRVVDRAVARQVVASDASREEGDR